VDVKSLAATRGSFLDQRRRRLNVCPELMHRLLGISFLAWALSPSSAGACGLSGPWYVSSEDGYAGIFIVEKAIDDGSCEARLSVFSPLGDSAVEICRVLRSDKVVIYCEIISGGFFKAQTTSSWRIRARS
jgi:hypothetical protein